jgi:transposase InsO family protein
MALEQALTLRQPAPGLIIHADRGSQYTSLTCRTRIEKAQALASYSRPGNSCDNAQVEAAGIRSKQNYCPAVAHLPASKKPDWR